jgi:hypothetical protein
MISRTPAHPIDRMPKLTSDQRWSVLCSAEVFEAINEVREMTRSRALCHVPLLQLVGASCAFGPLIVMLDTQWLIMLNDSILLDPA